MTKRILSGDLAGSLHLARRALDHLADTCGTPDAFAEAARAGAELDRVERRLAAAQADLDRGMGEIGDAIFKLASLDFTHTVPVSEDGTVLDGLRGGVNMLAEELAAGHRELVRAKVLAEQGAVAKSEFLSNMSHELRTPMHAILNYTEMALSRITADAEIERPRLQKYLTNMRISGKRLLALINDVLDLSKLEAGQMRISRKQGDFTSVVKQCLAELDSLFKAKTIEAVVLRGTPDCEAYFDFERMVQVLENVLGNAVRFAVRGSTVEIALREGPGTLICSVYNEGPSIPEAELEDIFDRFVQSSNVKKGAGGTGLGLAICRATMSAQGGRIWAQNTLAGVTMHISIPRQRPGLDAGGAASGISRGRTGVASQGAVAGEEPVADEDPGRRGYAAGAKGLRN